MAQVDLSVAYASVHDTDLIDELLRTCQHTGRRQARIQSQIHKGCLDAAKRSAQMTIEYQTSELLVLGRELSSTRIPRSPSLCKRGRYLVSRSFETLSAHPPCGVLCSAEYLKHLSGHLTAQAELSELVRLENSEGIAFAFL
jgi:hypothetical protein